ncbi:MAG: hypothetical protein RL295_2067, partial [Pseudomonadota bacterium]
MPVFASDIAAMHIGAGGHVTDLNGLISGVLTPCRLGRRSLQQAAMLASARPPCRSSAPAVSRRQSGHKHRRCMRTNSISTGRRCGDVFASDIAAMHIGAGGHATDLNGLISGVLTPCRLGRRSLQQAAMLASARPP